MRRALPRSAAWRLPATRARCIAPIAMAGRYRRRAARCRRCRRRARAVGAGPARSARHQIAARGQARLSPAFPAARQCGAGPPHSRCRKRLLPGADGAGYPAHHRRRIRARDAAPTPVQFDRVLPRARELFPLGDRSSRAFGGKTWLGARPCFADSRPVISRAPRRGRIVARLWPRSLGLDARAGNRPADRRDDDRR